MEFRIQGTLFAVLIVCAAAGTYTQAQTAGTAEDIAVKTDSVHGRQSTTDQGRGPGKGKGHNPPAFADFDTNSDGFINQDEFMAGHAVRFKQRAAEGRRMKNVGDLSAKFSSLDTDGDGRASQSEFAAHQETHRNMRRSKDR